MLDFCKVNFGYADAERELARSPELFDDAFIDPQNHLDNLLYDDKFLVMGRKGTGKTAYSAKIRRMAENPSSDLLARLCPLSRLDYTLFESFANLEVLGGRRFSSAWEYLFLIELMKMIDEDIVECENEQVLLLLSELKKLGMICDEDLVYTTKILQKQGLRLSFKGIEGFSENEKELILEDTPDIAELMLKVVKQLYFGDTRFFLIIDGLDDSIRGASFSSDILTGMLRAAEYLNRVFCASSLNFKIIILMRSDIFALCRDPDLTKMARDLSINLTWSEQDLKQVALKRIQQSYPETKDFEDFWYSVYPREIQYKDSLKRAFEHTLLRPRDFLQFLIESQKACRSKKTGKLFEYREVSNIIAQYSTQYFASEMYDELTGFLPDDAVLALTKVFSRLSGPEFSVEEFTQVISEHAEFVKHNPVKILETLFIGGYIGQLRKRQGWPNPFVTFHHINQLEHFEVKDRCLIHRGLRKAVNM